MKTRANPLGIELVIGNSLTVELTDNMFGLLVQYPAGNGEIRDYTDLFNKADSKNIFKTVAADLLSLLLLKAPGEFGADAVVGSSQRFGVPMGYGGPHAAYFATRESIKEIFPEGLLEFQLMHREAKLTEWLCRPGSSIFGGIKQPVIFALRRLFLQ